METLPKMIDLLYNIRIVRSKGGIFLCQTKQARG